MSQDTSVLETVEVATDAPPKNNPAAIADAIPRLVEILKPLTDEERHRAVAAVLNVFGQSMPSFSSGRQEASKVSNTTTHDGLLPKVSAWMQRHQISREALENVFAIDETGIEIIAAALPGKSRQEQTVQAYLLCGLRSFLRTGDTQFSDHEARQICQHVGCYESTNHSKAFRDFGNRLTGNKDAGWKLTIPGLSEAAQLVKSIAA